MSLLHLLLEPVWWNWYLAGVLLLCLEIMLSGVFILWFGLGALATGLFLQISGGFYWPYQMAFFAIVSVCSLLIGRRLIRRVRPLAHVPVLNRRLHSYIGQQAVLEENMVNGKTRIRLDGVYWRGKGPDLPAGTRVIITGVEEGILLLDKTTP
ncbi:MAG: NfeD family protein [Deltaproteobacteria bacterium]|jgi:membrane protein implicated in regulation of membrane protease activity|nr:NfeD family protein [Deltaproteobacteria bacterium]